MMKFGERLKQLRNNSKQTQEEVAQILHVSRQTISNWENERSYPDIDCLIQLSNHYDVSLDQLLKEDASMEKKVIKDVKLKKRYKRIILLGVALLAVFLIINMIWLSEIVSRNNYLSKNWEIQTMKHTTEGGYKGPSETYYYEKKQGKTNLVISKESYSSEFKNNYLDFFKVTEISGAYIEDEKIINVALVDKGTFLVSVPINENLEELVPVNQNIQYKTIEKMPMTYRPIIQLVDEKLIEEVNTYLSENKKEILEVKNLAEMEYQKIN